MNCKWRSIVPLDPVGVPEMQHAIEDFGHGVDRIDSVVNLETCQDTVACPFLRRNMVDVHVAGVTTGSAV
jgi:hypothetical protein